jgi:hypothetical protein
MGASKNLLKKAKQVHAKILLRQKGLNITKICEKESNLAGYAQFWNSFDCIDVEVNS